MQVGNLYGDIEDVEKTTIPDRDLTVTIFAQKKAGISMFWQLEIQIEFQSGWLFASIETATGRPFHSNVCFTPEWATWVEV